MSIYLDAIFLYWKRILFKLWISLISPFFIVVKVIPLTIKCFQFLLLFFPLWLVMISFSQTQSHIPEDCLKNLKNFLNVCVLSKIFPWGYLVCNLLILVFYLRNVFLFICNSFLDIWRKIIGVVGSMGCIFHVPWSNG